MRVHSQGPEQTRAGARQLDFTVRKRHASAPWIFSECALNAKPECTLDSAPGSICGVRFLRCRPISLHRAIRVECGASCFSIFLTLSPVCEVTISLMFPVLVCRLCCFLLFLAQCYRDLNNFAAVFPCHPSFCWPSHHCT